MKALLDRARPVLARAFIGCAVMANTITCFWERLQNPGGIYFNADGTRASLICRDTD